MNRRWRHYQASVIAALAFMVTTGPARAAELTDDQVDNLSMAEQVARKSLALMGQPEAAAKLVPYWMEPKGKTNLDALVAASVIGPIGLPAAEAMYPAVTTTNGKKLNAMHDYVIRMTKEQLPPAKAFWSVTLYDLKNVSSFPTTARNTAWARTGA